MMEYYCTLKGTELLSHRKTQKKFKCILLKENCQSVKATCHMSSIILHLEKKQNNKDSKKLSHW